VDNLRKEEIQDKSVYFNLKKRHLLQNECSLSDWVASEKGVRQRAIVQDVQWKLFVKFVQGTRF